MGREMRYQRGVPLTEEERGGGGQGAGRDQFDPVVMNLLGSMFQPQAQGGGTMWGGAGEGGWLGQGGTAPGGTIPPAAAGAVSGGNDAQTQMLKSLMDLYGQQIAKQPTVDEFFSAKRKARDPVAWAAKQRDARLAGDPWAEGGILAGRPKLTPAAAIASQGNNAVNQWAQLGGIEVGGQKIDPEEIRDFNRKVKLNRRSYT